MQKAKVLCLILAMVMASAGTVLVAQNFGDTPDVPVILPTDNDPNVYLDKPAEGDPSQLDLKENLYIAAGELKRSGGFVGVSAGTTTSMGMSQAVSNKRTVVNGNVFKQMATTGVISNAYQLYLYGSNNLYRKADKVKDANNIAWANTAQKFSDEDFIGKFGHRSDGLTGYILNDETITDARVEKIENGLYSYRYVLDINTAPARMLYEMKANSGMSKFSTFEKAEIVVTMDADWQVKSLRTDCKYKVPMLGGLDCVEDITETFSEIGYQGDLPEKDFFEQFFDAEPDTPPDEDPDALTVLMDIFQPYLTGNKLNVELDVSLGDVCLASALVAANIDINNLENISADVKVGEDLYLSYSAGKLLVDYQDFKASTTLDGIMGLVNAFLPKQDGSTDNANSSEETEDDITSKFTYTIKDGRCVVNMPITLGDVSLEANIYANVNDGKYEFIGADAKLGDVTIDVKPVEQFDVPARTGDYPEILGLLDLINNGIINANVNAFGMSIDVMFDLQSMSMFAQTGDLTVVFSDNVAYVTLGGAKLKLAVDDIQELIDAIGLFVDGGLNVAMPESSLDTIIAMLGNIKAASADGQTAFVFELGDLSASISLVSAANGWNISSVNVDYNDVSVAVTPADKFTEAIPTVNDAEYADVTSIVKRFSKPIADLIKGESFGVEFSANLEVNNNQYVLNGDFTYDKAGNIQVNALVGNGNVTYVNANVVVANNTVYLTANGIKAAFALPQNNAQIDLTQVVDKLKGIDDNVDALIDEITKIVGTVTHLDLAKIDFAKLISSLTYDETNGRLDVAVNAEDLAIGTFNVGATVVDGKLTATIGGLSVANVSLDVTASVQSNVADVVIPDSDDYVLKLKGSLSGVNIDLYADFIAMDIRAEVTYQDYSVLVRYIDGGIYMSVGEVKLYSNVYELAALIQELLAQLGGEQGVGFDIGSLDVKQILNSVVLNLGDDEPNVSVDLGGAQVRVNLDGEYNFSNISLAFGNIAVTVEQGDKTVEALEITQEGFVAIAPLARQAIAIYNAYKNVITEGISAKLTTDVVIDNSVYSLNATVRYHSGLYLLANISDGNKFIVNAEAYLVNNALYLDVNGIRVSTVLPESDNNNQITVQTVVDMLSKAHGYNDVLDSVITAVTNVANKFVAGVNYVDLIKSLTHQDETLQVVVNSAAIGLTSDVTVTVCGKQQLSVNIDGLQIGNVCIDNLSVNAEPKCDKVEAPETSYITELQIDVAGITAYLQLDLYNGIVRAHATLYGQEVVVLYTNGRAYVTYGNIKAYVDVNDIDRLLAVVGKFVDVNLNFDGIDLKQIISGIKFSDTETGFKVSLAIDTVNTEVLFNADSASVALAGANVTISNIDVAASVISGHTFPQITVDNGFVNVTDLAEAFADEIAKLINAQGYAVNANGSIILDGKAYGIQAEVNYNGGLYVKASLSLNGVLLAKAELYLVDNTLYADIAGVKLAVKLNTKSDNGEAKQTLQQTLGQFFGYNDYLDTVLNLVLDIASKAQIEDVAKLVGSLTFDGNTLSVAVNGGIYGLSDFNVSVVSRNGLTASINGLEYKNIALNVNANVAASSSVVTAPSGDYTTNIAIRLDETNVIYANIDLLTGVYRFRIGELYVTYADNTVKINYNNQLFVTGDISYIIAKVKEIDDLVKEFAGADKSEISEKLSLLESLDVKSIVKTLAITSDVQANTGKITLTALKMPIAVNLVDGMIDNVTIVTKKSTSDSKPDDTIVVNVTEAQSYYEFTGNENYVVIEEVFEDYFETFKKLVHTNSWRFDFNKQSEIAVGKDKYALAAGSYVEFYYKTTEPDQFKLRANVTLLKMNATTNRWEQFMTLDAVYVDGSIYVTYNGKLKATVSKATLMDCYNEVLPELTRVVPQIGDLIKKIGDAMTEVKDENKVIDFSTILRSISYENGVFSMKVNGSVILKNLGDISIVVSQTANGLSLDALSLVYDTINVNIEGMTVAASDTVTVDGQTQYVAVNEILSYDRTNHIDLNSLKALLLAFVQTADMKTTDAIGNEVRTFYIKGTVKADLSFAKGAGMISLPLEVRVDITNDNKTYLTLKLSHGNNRIVFKDFGADSYLYYDGERGLFSAVRNTKTGLFSNKKVDISKLDMTGEQFKADIFEIIFDLVNFSDIVENPIREAIQNPSNNEYGIEDIIKDYSYSEGNKAFALQADLSPIDSNLGTAKINILHNDQYSLTKLTGEIGLVKIISATLDLSLVDSSYGVATDYVVNKTLW